MTRQITIFGAKQTTFYFSINTAGLETHVLLSDRPDLMNQLANDVREACQRAVDRALATEEKTA